jgi:hypothetical protein
MLHSAGSAKRGRRRFFRTQTPGSDFSELKRLVLELQRQNLELARRVAAMEAANALAAQRQNRFYTGAAPLAPARATPQPAVVYPQHQPVQVYAPPQPVTNPTLIRTIPIPKPVRTMPQPAASHTRSNTNLEDRVRELELGQEARDAATRAIIRDSLSKIGPQINETAALSGALEVEFGKSKNFTGARENSITLSTVELELDLKMNEWVSASTILAYDPGNDVSFTSSDGSSREIDRFVADRAMISIGNIQLFPLHAELGRDTLPFGTSTGLARTSALSIASPLTQDAFETRANTIGVGFALPTPGAKPASLPVVVPTVKPLVLNPLVSGFARMLGYKPPPVPPKKPTPVFLPDDLPPFYGSFHAYEGSSSIGTGTDFTKNFVGSLGYRTSGHCGRPYSQLQGSFVCPWTLDFHVDYNSSIYSSDFLRFGYEKFLDRIGHDPGVAASLKLSAGPFALVAEINEALKRSSFVDDGNSPIQIRPAAWQVSLGYQFDWNPWVDTIGDYGTFVAIGYSRTRELAGVSQLIDGTLTRVGEAPKSRVILTAGEWVTSDLKLTFDFLVDWDYASEDGGTGERGYSIFTSLSYNF